ncbi:MAG: sodium:proton antiporter [Thermodesulfobacteriota bacterium]
MKKIVLFSCFLICGLVLSQVIPALLPAHTYRDLAHATKLLTTVALGFIMIRVGYEFDLDKTRVRSYGWDYIVAATAATFPWIFVALYFVFVLSAGKGGGIVWQEALLTSRFASPTSAGVLFTMLAAAGLTGTWMYRKIRVLAIFDDLDTVILMVPLKMIIVGLKWQLFVVLTPMIIFLMAAWRYLHHFKIPITWPWVLGYSVLITLAAEGIYLMSKSIDEVVTIHIEVLLPAFVLGCIILHQKVSSSDETVLDITDTPVERLVTVIVSTVFMALVGLSMPPIVDIAGPETEVRQAEMEVLKAYMQPNGYVEQKKAAPPAPSPEELQGAPVGEKSPGTSWPAIAFHVLMVTLISNIGKMFPFFCYRREASWQERMALAIGMFPRGEVGAGVLIISISYGIGGSMLTVAMLSLTLNLLLTGVFIAAVKKLLNKGAVREGAKEVLV